MQDLCCSNCLCDAGENREMCPADCPFGCNFDDVCEPEAHETHGNCPSDCDPLPPVCNNDGFCQPPGETPENCSNDCSESTCGNGWLDPGEDCETCAVDAAAEPTFTISPTTAQVGHTVTFTASQALESPPPLWDTGDGVHLAGNPATRSYATAGTYPILLTASEANCGLTRQAGPQTVTIVGGPPPPPPNNQPPQANAGGPYTGATLNGILFNGSASTDPDGNNTIASYTWEFGDGTSATGKLVQHVFTNAGTYTVRLTVRDNGGLSNAATTTATISLGVSDGRFHVSQGLTYFATARELVAYASMIIHPPDSLLYKPVIRAIVYAPNLAQQDLGFVESSVLRTFAVPAAGTWRMKADYYFASITNPAQRQLVESQEVFRSVEAPPGPTEAPQIAGNDELWYGPPNDSFHPITLRLQSFPIGTNCRWYVEQGSDKAKVEPGATCLSATLTSVRPSTSTGDVIVRVEVDGRLSDAHAVTVFRFYQLRRVGLPSDEPFGTGWITFIIYEVEHQLDGTVRDYWVKEDFISQGIDWPGPVNWPLPEEKQSFAPGTLFHDRIRINGPYTPSPVNPGHFDAARPVRYLGQQFSVGYAGWVLLQDHRQQWYLGFARHEDVVSPVLP